MATKIAVSTLIRGCWSVGDTAAHVRKSAGIIRALLPSSKSGVQAQRRDEPQNIILSEEMHNITAELAVRIMSAELVVSADR